MQENTTRAISGLVYVILLITSTLFSQMSFLALFGFFLFIAIIEFCDLVQLKKTNSIAIGIILFFLFSFFEVTISTKILLTIGSLYISLKLIYLLFSNKIIKLDNISKYVYLIGYVILPIIILTKIPTNSFLFEPKIIISIFILIWTNDTFAYIVGKTIGKNKLFETISPKKTIEGFIGGVIFAIIVSVVLSKYYLNFSIINFIIIAIIIGVFGTIGDLIESKFKRFANVKDSGTIMPGHGGILDRLDSAIFIAPFIYLFLQIFQYFTYA
ncbi:MAG: phosphatidate cytidylyltransferase [Flavobacterium sp.]|nr:phosphatidate cytidylyltransferase [Flavobacterium sp.]